MASDPRSNTGARAEELKHSAKSMAGDAAREARHQAGDLADQARDYARDGLDRARHEAERRAQEGVDYGASQVSSTADALRHASEEVEGTVQAQLLRYAADGLNEISDTIRGKSVGDIAARLADFGRRNPVAFLGGAALAGFAIARFARASRPQPRDYQLQGGYGPGNYRTPVYGRGMNQPVQPATSHTPAGAGGPVRPAGATPSAGATPGAAATGQRTPGATTTGATTPGSTGSTTGTAGSNGAGAMPGASRPANPTAGNPSASTPSTKDKKDV